MSTHARHTDVGPTAGDLLAEMARQEARIRNQADDVTSGDVWPVCPDCGMNVDRPGQCGQCELDDLTV